MGGFCVVCDHGKHRNANRYIFGCNLPLRGNLAGSRLFYIWGEVRRVSSGGCRGLSGIIWAALLVKRNLSNTASFVFCVVRRVKNPHNLLHYSPLLKKACVRQVALDKWFPLNHGGLWWPVDIRAGRRGSKASRSLLSPKPRAGSQSPRRRSLSPPAVHRYFRASGCLCFGPVRNDRKRLQNKDSRLAGADTSAIGPGALSPRGSSCSPAGGC